MILVRKVDGVWQSWNGVNEKMPRTFTTYNAVYADGRQVEVACDPYQADVVMSASAVSALLSAGTWTQNDLDPFGLKVAVPFVVPDGKQISGSLVIVDVDGVPHEDYPVEDIPPPPPPPTAAEKLEAAGLTVDELKQLLGIS